MGTRSGALVPLSDAGIDSVSGELLSAFMTLMPDAAVCTDADGVIVAANEQAELLFGYPERTLTGQSIETLIPERVRRRHRQHRAAYLGSPQSRPMGAGLELTGRRADGHEFPVDISLAPVTSAGRQLVIAAVRDVSDKQAAAAAQAELATIVRSSLDAIISMSVEGHVTSWNPAAEQLFGYGADMVGRHVATLVPDEESAVLEELLERACDGAAHVARDTRWRHRAGHDVDVAVSISPMTDSQGTLLGFSSIVRDIGERKRAEAQLRRNLAQTEQLERQHAVTSEIRLALLDERPVVDALRLICDRGAELLEAPVVVVCLRHEGELVIRAANAGAAALVGTSLAPGPSFAGRVLDSGRAQRLLRRSDGSSVAVPDFVPDGPTLGVPVVVGGTSSAALTCVRASDAPDYRPGDLVIAETIAAQAALAFELERGRRDRQEMMLLGDRDRIARDLHDLVIQELFGIGMSLQATLSSIGDHPAARDKVAGAVNALDRTISTIRTTIFALAPPPAAAKALRGQVLEVVRRSADSLGFEPAVSFDGLVDTAVAEPVASHVLAVVTEALSNAARHARASRARVSLSVSGGRLDLLVEDDGVGFASPPRSSGLANMAERAERCGGSCEVGPGPAGGTTVRWSVPAG